MLDLSLPRIGVPYHRNMREKEQSAPLLTLVHYNNIFSVLDQSLMRLTMTTKMRLELFTIKISFLFHNIFFSQVIVATKDKLVALGIVDKLEQQLKYFQ